MVAHIFDRSVGNLKPTIIFIWPQHLGRLSSKMPCYFIFCLLPDVILSGHWDTNIHQCLQYHFNVGHGNTGQSPIRKTDRYTKLGCPYIQHPVIANIGRMYNLAAFGENCISCLHLRWILWVCHGSAVVVCYYYNSRNVPPGRCKACCDLSIRSSQYTGGCWTSSRR